MLWGIPLRLTLRGVRARCRGGGGLEAGLFLRAGVEIGLLAGQRGVGLDVVGGRGLLGLLLGREGLRRGVRVAIVDGGFVACCCELLGVAAVEGVD